MRKCCDSSTQILASSQMEEELRGSHRAHELFSEFKWLLKSNTRKLPRCDESSEYSSYGLAFTEIKRMF